MEQPYEDAALKAARENDSAAAKLASAIQAAAVRLGICRDDAPLTGPHLLMLLADLEALASRGIQADQQMAELRRGATDIQLHICSCKSGPDGHASFCPAGQLEALFRPAATSGVVDLDLDKQEVLA